MTDSPASRRVAIVAIGDELLNGQQLDTNSSWLCERLWTLGWEVLGVTTIGDQETAIAATLGQLSSRADLILTTGGLGPTLDDVTREAAARAADCALELDPAVLQWLEQLFAKIGRSMSSSNERQAWFPAGSVVLANSTGTAPGFRLQLPNGTWVASFPGPPRELFPMFEDELLGFLQETYPDVPELLSAAFNLYGISESDFAGQVGDWMARDADPRMGVCASGRILKVRIEGHSAGESAGRARFEDRVQQFQERFEPAIFSRTSASTALALAELLLEREVTFACAESCTGGEIASRLIARPGISSVFLEGFVTYSNAAKRARLGVPPELLEAHGAVSQEVAAAMAEGAARACGARLAVSTTGVAGPGGGSPEKPVGLVHIGVHFDGETTTHELRFPDRGRDLIRDWATTSACELARRALLGPNSGPSVAESGG